MPTLDFSKLIASPMWAGSQDGTSATPLASTGYTYGSAGNSFGIRFSAPSTSLEKVYFYVDDGTASVNTGPLVEVRNWNTSTATAAGTTLIDSVTTTYAGDGQWQTATFSTPITMVVGTHYWIVIAGKDSDTFDFIYSVSSSDSSIAGFTSFFRNTNGWTSGGILSNKMPIVLKFSDGTIFGNPYSNQTSTLSTTTEYGIKIDPLKTGMQISNILLDDNLANLQTIKVYRGNSPPGAPERTITPVALSLTNGWFAFSPILLKSSTPYRITFSFSTSVTPTKLVANNASIRDVLNCGVFGGKTYLTMNNGGVWEDHREMFPLFNFAIKGFDNVD